MDNSLLFVTLIIAIYMFLASRDYVVPVSLVAHVVLVLVGLNLWSAFPLVVAFNYCIYVFLKATFSSRQE